MSENHLIIGIGGTGGKIIRELRKTILQQFRKESVDGVNIEYLYIDSSDADMAPDDENWKTLGTSVQLSKKNQLLLQGGDLTSRLENQNQYPGIKKWIGPRDLWLPYLKSIQGTKAAAGQRRRLGRFLFACNVAKFNDSVKLQVAALQRTSSNTSVTFHVCCGLAGGTGSGSVVDAVAQIRANYPVDATQPGGKYRIVVYCLLPEEKPKPNWALSGYYHANGYAALVELNAISAGAWDPHDLTGEKDRLAVPDPFNVCYLFTNENENGVPVDVEIEVPSLVADFLFQKIINAGDDKLEHAENAFPKPETNAGSARGERSLRFMTFGIKRLAFPEEEITEYLTYSFAHQACLQLRYNHWTDERGFIDEPRNQDFGEYIKQKETLSKWLISDEHFCLSLGILPEEQSNKKWKPIEEEWRTVIPQLKNAAWVCPEPNKLDALGRLCEKRFTTDYRGIGVDGFYKTKLQSRREHAQHLRAVIEDELIADWKNGVRSAFEISKLLDVLKQYFGTRRTAFEAKSAECRDIIERESANIQGNQKEWAKVGLFSGLLGKHQKLFDAQAVCLETIYVCKTRLKALEFAQKLVEELEAELEALKGEVDRCAAMISDAIDRYHKGIEQRCKDPVERFDYKKQLIRFYNSDLVRKVVGGLVRIENEQKTQVGKVRAALLEPLGERPSFVKFNDRIQQQSFLDFLGQQCKENGVIAHSNQVKSPRERLLGVNVIDKLKERFGDDQELRVFVSELVKHAGNFALLNEAELRNSEAGNPGSICISNFSVLIPNTEDAFIDRLKDAFRKSRSTDINFILGKRKNEICMISQISCIPARALKVTKFLRERYNLAVKGANPAEAKMFLHLEGDGTQHPGIFGLSADDLVKVAVPYLLLAKGLNLLQESTSKALGRTTLSLIIEDENGLEVDQIELGSTLIESRDKLDLPTFVKLSSEVDRRFASSSVPKDELTRRIVAEVKAIKVLQNNDSFDPVYKLFNEGAAEAINRVKQS